MKKEATHKTLFPVCKTAEAARLYSKVMQKVAEHRPRPSDAYIAGFCKAAEDAGVDPVQLIKAAGWWSDKWSGLKQDMQDAWEGTKGFVGAFVDPDLYKDFGKNIWSGTKSALTGLGQGVAALPGLVGNVAGGAVGLVTGAFGDGSYLDNVKNSWNAGGRLVDSIGIGDYDLKHLKDKLDTVQANNKSEYMANNNMDPNNMNGWERWGMHGMNLANAAGQALPGAYVGAKTPGLKWTAQLGGAIGGSISAGSELLSSMQQTGQDIASAQRAYGGGKVNPANKMFGGTGFTPPSSFNSYSRVQFNV